MRSMASRSYTSLLSEVILLRLVSESFMISLRERVIFYVWISRWA